MSTPTTHYITRLSGYNSKLACGRNVVTGRSFIQLAATQDKSEVTCARCLAKMAKIEAAAVLAAR